MARPGAEEIQLDLILDCRSNVAAYPAFQAYFRTYQPPLLAVWASTTQPLSRLARRPTAGICQAEVHLLDTGHFALETHAVQIADYISDVLSRTLRAAG